MFATRSRTTPSGIARPSGFDKRLFLTLPLWYGQIASSKGANKMRLKLLVGISAITIMALVFFFYEKPTVSPVFRGSSTDRIQIYSPSGVRLSSFFQGLPVDSRFERGENGFLLRHRRDAHAKPIGGVTLWLKALWGATTVHAQACTYCQAKPELWTCQCSPGGNFWGCMSAGCACGITACANQTCNLNVCPTTPYSYCGNCVF